ncbi:MAG: TIGR03560 family F420-dependent LLM class oxidoreductase [Chloroflexi bacterium]|nr:TIGR03560 family F420-dependent LLM class oxidoreductase [Chloroflexota bacterium]
MKLGVIVPQGVDHEYDGWDPSAAWRRSIEVARHAEELGFESIWLYDHFQTDPTPEDEITFEAFTLLAALGAWTERVRLGHLVLGAGYRNPALVAKMASTLDVVTDGRMELGLGAGWKEDEYLAFGYDFPPTRERLAILGDTLEIVARMFSGTHATFAGKHRLVTDAINVPAGLQKPRIPIVVGGNGPSVTFRLAARHADELNLDGLTPEEVARAIPLVRDRCDEIGRDPDSLRISVHLWGPVIDDEGPIRTRRLAAYRELGVSRVIAQIHASATDLAVLDSFRDDAVAAGAHLS